MKILKPKFWKKKNSLLSYFLLPLSVFLQLFLYLQSKVVKKKKFSIPIICIGNIYLGGTGKTPLSLEVAKILQNLNKKIAIVKKPYKNHADEFQLIEAKLVPLFKDFSRHKSIENAIKNKFDCVILDDGFQDFSINKNLNIICFNENQLVGNGMTLPSGPLREPLCSLKRSQIVVINGQENLEFEKKIKHISSDINIYYSKYLPVNIEDFRNKDLFAFAGIGNPENFFSLLQVNDLKIKEKISFPDHYNYSLKELNKLIYFATKNNLQIVTTEKDYFRIKRFELPQIESLNVKLKIFNSDMFEEEIKKYL